MCSSPFATAAFDGQQSAWHSLFFTSTQPKSKVTNLLLLLKSPSSKFVCLCEPPILTRWVLALSGGQVFTGISSPGGALTLHVESSSSSRAPSAASLLGTLTRHTTHVVRVWKLAGRHGLLWGGAGIIFFGGRLGGGDDGGRGHRRSKRWFGFWAEREKWMKDDDLNKSFLGRNDDDRCILRRTTTMYKIRKDRLFRWKICESDSDTERYMHDAGREDTFGGGGLDVSGSMQMDGCKVCKWRRFCCVMQCTGWIWIRHAFIMMMRERGKGRKWNENG